MTQLLITFDLEDEAKNLIDKLRQEQQTLSDKISYWMEKQDSPPYTTKFVVSVPFECKNSCKGVTWL